MPPETPSSAPLDPSPPAHPRVEPTEQPQALRLVADVWRAIGSHWRVATLFFVAANAAVLAGIMLCPRSYESEAKIRVNSGRENSTIDPATQAVGQVMLGQSNREQDLTTAVDVLESRAVLEFAVRRIGPEPILKGFVPAEGEAADDAGGALDPDAAQQIAGGPLVTLGLSDPVSRYEKAVQALSQMVEVNSNKKSDVISIAVEAEKPALAQRICAEIVAGFRQKYQEASETEGSSEFFAQKATEAKDDLDRAATELADELNALGISTVEGRRQQLQEELSRLSAEEMDRGKVLEGTLAEVAGYDRVLTGTPETIDSGQTTGSATSAPDSLRKEIADMEARREKIVRETSAKAPGAVRLARQIDASEQLLESVSAESNETTTAVNPVWQDLMKSKLTAEAKAAGLKAELAELRAQSERARAQVAALNSRESRIVALQTERDELAKGLSKYVEMREQTKVADEMDSRSISSVNVFQQPSFNSKPVAPKKRLIALAGLVFASFGALGLCLALEYRSIFFPDEGLPYDSTPHDHAAVAHGGPGSTNGWTEPAYASANVAPAESAASPGPERDDFAPTTDDAATSEPLAGRPR